MSKTITRRPRIDTAWFQAQVTASRFGGLRPLAAAMRHSHGRFTGRPWQATTLWQAIHGNRPLRIEDVRQLATLLGKPLADVMRRAGVDVRDEPDDIEARHRLAVRTVGSLMAFCEEHGVPLPKRLRDQVAAVIA